MANVRTVGRFRRSSGTPTRGGVVYDHSAITPPTTLVIQDATHAHAADNLTLTQHNVLAIQDASHGHTADNLALTQHNILVIQDASHGHTADNVSLTQHNTLAVADAAHAHSADNLTLTQHNVLAIQDATHGHSADNIALTQHNVLAIQDASHGHTADNVVLTQHNVLAIQDASHGHAADNLTLTAHEPGASLVIADAAHAHAADSLSLTQHNVLAIQDAAHGHTADNLSLTQHNVLVVQDAAHGHTADSLVLTQHNVLAIQDALHAHAADNLTVTAHDPSLSTLEIQDAAHAHSVENVTLIEHNILVIQDARHAHRTDVWDALAAIGDGDETVTFNADGTITLSDGGDGDFWATSDNGAMITRDIGTPGKVEANVTSDLSQTETNLRFMGLRSSAAADAAMFVLLTDADNSAISTVWRDTVGGVAGYQGEDVVAYSDALPLRGRVRYDGTTAYAEVSTDGGSTWTLVNSRAIGVTLDVAFLANGGGGGAHVSTSFSNEMHLSQHNVLVISDALHAHTADSIGDIGGVIDQPAQQDFVRLRRRKAPIGSR